MIEDLSRCTICIGFYVVLDFMKQRQTVLQEKEEQQNCKSVRFEDFSIHKATQKAIRKLGFEEPSPIQAEFIPVALTGKDALGQAQTGTGKTAAFVIPILEQIESPLKRVQALIVAPTRELSEQVANEARRLSRFHHCRTAVLVGGRPLGAQIENLRKGAQIVVGTPGRIKDLLNRGVLQLEHLKVAVLDEADRMLDIGFRPDIEKILKRCPSDRQTLLLSATVPPEVERIAKRFMKDPVLIDLSVDQVAVDSIDQFYVTVDEGRKFPLLVKLLSEQRPQQVIVFTRTKRGADKLHAQFKQVLPHVSLLHGDLPQSQRDRTMKKFREGKVRLLIATDVVGRGIDVSGISHIINYDIPEDCDDYVHRIGRTGRLSSDENGTAFTFVTKEQGDELTRIEVRINSLIPQYTLKSFDAFQPRESTPDPHFFKLEQVEEFSLS